MCSGGGARTHDPLINSQLPPMRYTAVAFANRHETPIISGFAPMRGNRFRTSTPMRDCTIWQKCGMDCGMAS